ncbi:MAG: helix-turn-helix domain-containing protein [Chitinispirillales bacterium]|nr:helix-turn-helix domain-containing protein [Chitinispirillales bacterium]
MRTKTPKVYTLAQVGKLLGVHHNTIYNYINAGLIKVLPRAAGTKEGRKVTEAEFTRIKRDGIDPTGLKAKLAGLSGAAGKAAKKRVKRAAPKPAKKKSVYTHKAAAKKQVKRNAATRTVVKKQAGRAGAATRKKRSP